MELKDVPSATVEEFGAGKILAFLLMRLYAGEDYSKTKVILRTGNAGVGHPGIVDATAEECSSFGLEPLGGGLLSIVRLTKAVRIYHYSLSYGEEPDRDETATMLKEVLPGYTIHVD